MKTKLLVVAVAAASFGFSGAALADTMNFSSTPGADTFTATSIDITNPGTVHPVTGTYFSVLDTGSTSFSPTTWTSSDVGPEILTVTEGAHIDTIDITSFSFSGSTSLLTIMGSGTSVLDGGAVTPIEFVLTTQTTIPGSATSFSGTVSTVPLPGTIALFGSGLVGLLALGKKRKQKAQLASA